MKSLFILGAVAVAAGGIWLYTSNLQPKCDSADAVTTLKSMVLEKINSSDGNSYLLRNVFKRRDMMGNTYEKDLVMDSFRKRDEVGTTGSNCAAQIKVSGWIDIPVEYKIEPTTDGKTMVTARFTPYSY